MGRKILKYVLRTLLVLLGVLILLPGLLYVPFVQDIVRRKGVGIASEKTGMALSVSALRLSFPLKLSLEGVCAVQPPEDTLLRAGALRLDVALLPLIRSRVIVRQLSLEDAFVHYADSVTGFGMKVGLGRLALRVDGADLKRERAEIPFVTLDSARIEMLTGVSLPDTAAASPMPGWVVDVARIRLRNVDFSMNDTYGAARIAVRVPDASVRWCGVDLGRQSVAVKKVGIEGADYTYLTDTLAAKNVPPAVRPDTLPADTAASLPWSVRVERLALTGNAVSYGVTAGEPAPGFDPDHVRVTGLDLSVDTLYNRGSEVRARIAALSFRERSGLRVEALTGGISMDSLGYRLSGLRLRLPGSELSADAEAGASVAEMDPAAPVALSFGARLATADLMPFLPADSSLRRVLEGRTLSLEGEVAGRLNDLEIGRLAAALPGVLSVAVSGDLRSALEPGRLSGRLRLSGDFPDLASLLPLLPDTALRKRIALPPMRLRGDVLADAGSYAPRLTLYVDESAGREVRTGTADTLSRSVAVPFAAASDSSHLSVPVLAIAPDTLPVRPAPLAVDSLPVPEPFVPHSGSLSVVGTFAPLAGRYDARMEADDFPLSRFLPADSLGRLSMTVEASGERFDPFDSLMRMRADLRIGQLDFRGYDYAPLSVEARLERGTLTGRLGSTGPALAFSFDVDGTLTRERQQAVLRGELGRLDLQRLGFVDEPIGGSLVLDVSASASEREGYEARVALGDIVIRDRQGDNPIRPTAVSVAARPDEVSAEFTSGDLRMEFYSPVPADTLTAAFGRAAALVSAQLAEGSLAMDTLNKVLPVYNFTLSAGTDNILNNYLRTMSMGFRTLSVASSASPATPLGLDLVANGWTTASVVLDTLSFGFDRVGDRLDYNALFSALTDRDKRAARIALDGYLLRNNAYLHALQRSRTGETGFDIGVRAAYADSTVRLSVRPDTLVLGYESWAVNDGNFVSYRFGGAMEGDLRLTSRTDTGQHFYLLSAGPGFVPGGIRLDLAKLNLQTALGMFPGSPPVSGTLDADMLLGLVHNTVAARGKIGVTELGYDGSRVGNLALEAGYKTLPGGQQFGAKLSVDGTEALSASGRYVTEASEQYPEGLSAKIDIPGLPLAAANAFLPADMARLSGKLKGSLKVEGGEGLPLLVGSLRFDGTKVEVPMIGAAFGISDTPVTIDRNRIVFEDFALIAPNKSRMRLDGSVDARDPARMTTDLRVAASDFQVLDVARKRGAMLFGRADIDLHTTVRGPLDALDIQGGLNLLGGTQVTYVMQASPLEVKTQNQEVVEFVNFADTTAVLRADSMNRIRVGGMNLLMNVGIAQDVQMSVYLSDDGNNRINLKGGGNLTYTVNPLGDSRFSGKYVLSGGTVRYNPPVISEKVFDITQGSFVEWTGEMADPSFNITAVETVRTTVTSEDGTSRPVNFNISINIRNTLKDMAITFDLSAPDDLTIQNQLTSLTGEQRSTQAMSLLVYNTYNGPGTTAKADSANPLNSFIEKELNQWARNNLKGVDLSFGIDTYNQVTAEGESQRTDYSYKLSKSLFNNRVRTVIGGKISTDADPGEGTADNLIDDISLEYMLTKRDNMFLKVFRHTGFESILEGEITQTGFGFVVRKKMLKLGDLFRITRPRKRKEDKGQKSAAPLGEVPPGPQVPVSPAETAPGAKPSASGSNPNDHE